MVCYMLFQILFEEGLDIIVIGMGKWGYIGIMNGEGGKCIYRFEFIRISLVVYLY